MQSLQVLSLVRTRLEHEALAAVLGSLTTLTTLKLAWYTSSPSVCASCISLEQPSWLTYALQCHASVHTLRNSPVGSLNSVQILAEDASSYSCSQGCMGDPWDASGEGAAV